MKRRAVAVAVKKTTSGGATASRLPSQRTANPKRVRVRSFSTTTYILPTSNLVSFGQFRLFDIRFRFFVSGPNYSFGRKI
jgi:hypothetical protein